MALAFSFAAQQYLDSNLIEYRVADAEGQWVWLQVRGKLVERGDQDRPIRVTGTAKNITARKSAEWRLITAAQILENSHDAVAILDLEHRFVQVNDSLGKVAGDLVLKIVAERLRKAMREEDTIARLGADEFAILIEGTESDREVEDLARVLFNAFKGPIQVATQNLRVRASIGISVYPNDGNESDDLIQNAQTAVSVAKDKKQGGAIFYAGEMSSSALDRLRMEEQLGGAIQKRA